MTAVRAFLMRSAKPKSSAPECFKSIACQIGTSRRQAKRAHSLIRPMISICLMNKATLRPKGRVPLVFLLVGMCQLHWQNQSTS